MYSIKLPWKSFNLDMPSLEAWGKTLDQSYKGNSADSVFTLWFDNDPYALPMHDVQQTQHIEAADAVKASHDFGDLVVSAVEAGAAGNVTLEVAVSNDLASLIAAHNMANDVQLEITQGMNRTIEAGSYALSGGADEVEAHDVEVTVSVPTGDPSIAQIAQAKWDALTEQSAEATAFVANQQMNAIKAQVTNINKFTTDLLNQFAAENIAMGITQDGKTEDVLDVMLPVMNALQGGAPTVAIKRAKAISESDYDAKYITAARLLSYVNKIEAFLGLPLSQSLS